MNGERKHLNYFTRSNQAGAGQVEHYLSHLLSATEHEEHFFTLAGNWKFFSRFDRPDCTWLLPLSFGYSIYNSLRVK